MNTFLDQYILMKHVLIVGLGSFAGGILRYLLSAAVQGKTDGDFPYGTLTVNLIGCFVIGCLFGLAEKWQLGIEWRLLLITGLVGWFTTFSAFSIETFHLIKSGQTIMAVVYVLSTVLIGVGLTASGVWLSRIILR